MILILLENYVLVLVIQLIVHWFFEDPKHHGEMDIFRAEINKTKVIKLISKNINRYALKLCVFSYMNINRK